MPTILVVDGYRFFFYSNEGHEPAHIHIEKGDGLAKWWLDPIREARTEGFSQGQRRRIRAILLDHEEAFLEAWYRYLR
jgi:hypothetical protein